jgi:Arc/MetJ-type ribon-helix-helix transcriptional regulator
MNVRLTPASEQLLKEQLAHGSFRSPEEVIQRALEVLAEKTPTTEDVSKNTTAYALADILNRKGVTLGGIRIHNLTHEGQPPDTMRG